MKKKIVALLLCVCMAATATACGNNKKGETENGTEVADATETTSFASIDYHAADYVKLGDYKGLDVTIDDDYMVEDSDVADYINNNVIANYPYYTDSDKQTVESGDFVNIDYTGTKDGKEFDGGSATGYVLEIGSKTFIDGFEDGLIGMNVGDEKDLNLTFPENYSSKDLAGQDVVFHVKVNKIVNRNDMSYDTLSDEYVSYLSDKTGMSYDNKDKMVSDIRDYLQTSQDSSKQSAIRTAALQKLAENCTVDGTPDGLLDAKVAEVLKQYESYYCQDGTKLEDYVKNSFNMEYADFLAEIEKEVKDDLETQLILETIADKEGIKLDDYGFADYVKNMMSSNGYESEDKLYESYASTAKDGKAYLQKVYVCNQALQVVVDNAKVTVQEPENTETEVPAETETPAETEAATE